MANNGDVQPRTETSDDGSAQYVTLPYNPGDSQRDFGGDTAGYEKTLSRLATFVRVLLEEGTPEKYIKAALRDQLEHTNR